MTLYKFLTLEGLKAFFNRLKDYLSSNYLKINGTAEKAVKDSSGKVIKDSYLPLSGGTMTGGINWTTPSIGIYNANDTTNNYKYMQLISGEWRKGSSIELNTDGDVNEASSAVIWSEDQAFRFKDANGYAQVTASDKWYINKWGGGWTDVANGNVVLSNSSSAGGIGLNSASSYTGGAYCRFFSSNWTGDTAGAGRFNITAVGTSGSATLMGTPNGRLSWCGLPLNTISFSAYLVVSVSSGSNGITISYTTPTGYTAIPINARTHGWGGGPYILNFSNSSATIWLSQNVPSTAGSYSVGCDVLFIRNFN